MYLSVSKPMPVAMPVMIGCTISEATGISGPQLSHAKPKRILKFEHEPKHPRQISMFTVCASKRPKLVDIGIGHEDGKTWEKTWKQMKKTAHSTGCINQHRPSLLHISSTCCLLLCGKGTAQGLHHSMQPAVWVFRCPRHNGITSSWVRFKRVHD